MTTQQVKPDPKEERQHLTQFEEIHTNKDGKSRFGQDCSKPSSRPKRRCHFGPRARSKHVHKRIKRDTHALDTPYYPLRKKEDSSFGRNTEVQPVFQTPHTKSSPFGGEKLTLPDRVTLQPGPRTRRTPFDFYKKNEVVPGLEFNSTKRAAKSLGVSVQTFEDSLTKEIDELLCEIEASRREELRFSETDSAGVCEQDPTRGSVGAKPRTLEVERTVLYSNQTPTDFTKGVCA